MPTFKHKSTREIYTKTKTDFYKQNYKTLYLCTLNTLFTICGLIYAGFVQKLLPENGFSVLNVLCCKFVFLETVFGT